MEKPPAPALNAAEQHLKDYVKEKTGYTMRIGEIRDFRLDADEDTDTVESYANDYISELNSNEAEYRQHQRDMGLCDDTHALDMNLNY
jgi:hypothetical protein